MQAGDVRPFSVVLGIGGVALVSGFHAFWGLAACMDDSGAPDRTYLDRCWAYNTSRGDMEPSATLIYLAPIGLVAGGALLAALLRLPAIFAVAAVVGLAFAVGAFFMAPLYLD